MEAYEYSWGERAKLELTKRDVFDMVCEVNHVYQFFFHFQFNLCFSSIFNSILSKVYECEPKMFKEQYDKVSADDVFVYN